MQALGALNRNACVARPSRTGHAAVRHNGECANSSALSQWRWRRVLTVTSAAGRGAAAVVASKKKEIMMWEALREATDEEMERDPTVCVMGELLAALRACGIWQQHTAQRDLQAP
jgi:hypothetical protein